MLSEPGETALTTTSLELIYPGFGSNSGCPHQDLFPNWVGKSNHFNFLFIPVPVCRLLRSFLWRIYQDIHGPVDWHHKGLRKSRICILVKLDTSRKDINLS